MAFNIYQELRREAVRYYVIARKKKTSQELVKPTYSSDLCLLHKLLRRPDKGFQKKLYRYDAFLAMLSIK